MTILTRRSILRGLLSAPAIVAASSLMPMRGLIMSIDPEYRFIQLAIGYRIMHEPGIIKWSAIGNPHSWTLPATDEHGLTVRDHLTPDTTPPSADGA